MSKPDKKKPTHSVFSNSLWACRMLIRYSPAAFMIFLFMIPVNIGLQYLGIYLPSLVISEVTTQQTLYHALLTVGGVMLALLLGNMSKQAFGYIQNAKLGVYRYKLIDLQIRKQLGMFYQTYEKKEIRDLSVRAGKAAEMWDGIVPCSDIVKKAFGILENLLGYLFFGAVISFASPWLIPILTITPLVDYFANTIYRKWRYQHLAETTDINQKLGYVEELPDDFSAAKDIRIYSMGGWLKECFREMSAKRAEWDKRDVKHRIGASVPNLFIILIRDGGAYALLISMFAKGEISVDQFVLYLAAISSFAKWVEGIMRNWLTINSVSLYISDFRDFIDYPEEDGSGSASADDHIHSAPEIVFDHVSYRYDGAEEDTIKDLSFTLKPGEKLALVGMNGAGKTTVVKLLCGLYQPTGGEIRINGISFRDFKREDYYRLISPVFQDVRTAFFSLAETVSCCSLEDTDITLAEQCMRKAGLGEKIDTLPDGVFTKLDKRINKDGSELSGGEKQKLMLARALYKDAPMLVLDEPTAALDPIAESRIYAEYNDMCADKTSLFISHRLASTSFCDRIILLAHGQIAEQGTHAELLRLGGEYARLFDIQSCWYQDDRIGGDQNDA